MVDLETVLENREHDRRLLEDTLDARLFAAMPLGAEADVCWLLAEGARDILRTRTKSNVAISSPPSKTFPAMSASAVSVGGGGAGTPTVGRTASLSSHFYPHREDDVTTVSPRDYIIPTSSPRDVKTYSSTLLADLLQTPPRDGVLTMEGLRTFAMDAQKIINDFGEVVANADGFAVNGARPRRMISPDYYLTALDDAALECGGFSVRMRSSSSSSVGNAKDRGSPGADGIFSSDGLDSDSDITANTTFFSRAARKSDFVLLVETLNHVVHPNGTAPSCLNIALERLQISDRQLNCVRAMAEKAKSVPSSPLVPEEPRRKRDDALVASVALECPQGTFQRNGCHQSMLGALHYFYGGGEGESVLARRAEARSVSSSLPEEPRTTERDSSLGTSSASESALQYFYGIGGRDGESLLARRVAERSVGGSVSETGSVGSDDSGDESDENADDVLSRRRKLNLFRSGRRGEDGGSPLVPHTRASSHWNALVDREAGVRRRVEQQRMDRAPVEPVDTNLRADYEDGEQGVEGDPFYAECGMKV